MIVQCPKCDKPMQDLEASSIPALKCSGCSGLWFRGGSHEAARDMEGVESIDEGPGPSTADLNQRRDIDCPECGKKLIRMVDRVQYHIQFEACTYCQGAFFDAGELTDFSEYTVGERISQALRTLKTNLGK